MIRYALLGLTLVLSGCAAAPRQAVVVRTDLDARQAQRQRANLVLGPDSECLAIAGSLGRAEWPTTVVGYWLDDVSFHSDYQTDNQFHYDRFGAYYRTTEDFRSAVLLR